MQKVLYMLDLLFLINQKNKNYEKKNQHFKKDSMSKSTYNNLCTILTKNAVLQIGKAAR